MLLFIKRYLWQTQNQSESNQSELCPTYPLSMNLALPRQWRTAPYVFSLPLSLYRRKECVSMGHEGDHKSRPYYVGSHQIFASVAYRIHLLCECPDYRPNYGVPCYCQRFSHITGPMLWHMYFHSLSNDCR